MENWENKETKIHISLNDENKNTQGQIIINFHRIPENCNECPLQFSYYDEEAFWGSGEQKYCIFGGSIWGSAVKRPKNCPIKRLKEKNMKEVYKMRESIKNSRCYKCLYSNLCTDIDNGNCKKYKKDPPDGGYYS